MANQNNLTEEQQILENVKCSLDPIYFIETYLKVIYKDNDGSKLIDFKLLPHQQKIIKNLLSGKDNIISKYRQGGVTTLVCAFCVWKICFSELFKIAVVANRLDTAVSEMFKKIIDFLEFVPSHLKPVVNPDKNSEKYKIWDNKCELKAFPSSKNGLRGFSPNLVFLDEAAFFEHGEEFYTSTRLTIAAGGNMIVNSTPNGQDKLYYPIYEGARNKQNAFILNEIFWYEDPRYNKDLTWVKEDIVIECREPNQYDALKRDGFKPTSTWYRTQCIELHNNPKKIAQELENNFNASSGLFIQEDIIKIHESQYVTEPIEVKFKQEIWIWEEPIPGQKYVLGSDVSMNVSKGDFSTFVVLKITPDGFQTAVEFQGRISPEDLGVLIYEYGIKYNAYVVIDNSGGQGHATITKLFDLGYKQEDVYHQKTTDRGLKEHMKNMANFINSEEPLYPGIQITTANRTYIINCLEEHLRKETLQVLSTRVITELRTFVIKENGKVEHKKGHHDDLLFAYAIAMYVVGLDFNKIKITPEQSFALLDMMEEVNFNHKKEKNNNNNPYAWAFEGLI